MQIIGIVLLIALVFIHGVFQKNGSLPTILQLVQRLRTNHQIHYPRNPCNPWAKASPSPIAIR